MAANPIEYGIVPVMPGSTTTLGEECVRGSGLAVRHEAGERRRVAGLFGMVLLPCNRPEPRTRGVADRNVRIL